MLIFDCEIKKMIQGRNEYVQPDLQYCAGWSDYSNMGISVVCAFDTDAQIMHTLLAEDNNDHKDMLQRLINRADYVIGFNNHKFDNSLLAAYGIHIPVAKSYDIYQQVISCVGGGFKKGYGLDSLARANGIPGKGEVKGALAPALYQRRELEKLYDYCADDVRITESVLSSILSHSLVCPVTRGILPVSTPQMVLGSTQAGLF